MASASASAVALIAVVGAAVALAATLGPPPSGLNLAAGPGLLLCLALGAAAALAAAVRGGRGGGDDEDAGAPLPVELVRALHFAVVALNIAYVFVFRPSYDGAYAAYMLLLAVHWIALRNECVLSLAEKWLADPAYRPGHRSYDHPFMRRLAGRHADAAMTAVTLFMLYNLSVVVRRAGWLPPPLKAVAVGLMWATVLWNAARRSRPAGF